jgi:hypothetical protein
MIGQEILNLKKRTDKYLNSSIELATHTQMLKQQQQKINGRNHYIPEY